MTRKRRDAITAADGWSITWNLDATPQEIKVYNRPCVIQSCVKGKIDTRYLERKIGLFNRIHNWSQLDLFTLEPTS